MNTFLKMATLSLATLAGATSFAAAQYADDYGYGPRDDYRHGRYVGPEHRGYDDRYGYNTNDRGCAPGTNGTWNPSPDGIPHCVQSDN
ncbi:hypothetical protein [Prosthecomicrobium pneumaticum]|uniref:Uncharacterized protein n=1 Tax=Prosthecomicrobium pneumaticum TaxID=81895 RepID=A0A7W9L3X6_9HYPH|nr:hypothetical protein [Prosthecomicrobium pneumaticum]MBB5755018.1 hypothetical protein [Prosthecomicrobium pneumaticum]